MATGDGQLLQGLGNLIGSVTDTQRQRNQQSFELDRTDMLTRLNNERDAMLMETQAMMQEYNSTRQQMNQRRDVLAQYGLVGAVKGIDDTGGIGRLASFAGSTLQQKSEQLYGAIAEMEAVTGQYTQAISDYTRGTQLATGFSPQTLEELLNSGGVLSNDEAMQLWIQKNPSYAGMDESQMFDDPMFRGFLDTITNTEKIQSVIKSQVEIDNTRQSIEQGKQSVLQSQEQVKLITQQIKESEANIENAKKQLENQQWKTAAEHLAYVGQQKEAIAEVAVEEVVANTSNPLISTIASIQALPIAPVGGNAENPSKATLIDEAIKVHLESDRGQNDFRNVMYSAHLSAIVETYWNTLTNAEMEAIGQGMRVAMTSDPEFDPQEEIIDAAMIRYAQMRNIGRGKTDRQEIINDVKMALEERVTGIINSKGTGDDDLARSYNDYKNLLVANLSDASSMIIAQTNAATTMSERMNQVTNNDKVTSFANGFAKRRPDEEGLVQDAEVLNMSARELFFGSFAPFLVHGRDGHPTALPHDPGRMRSAFFSVSDILGDTPEMRSAFGYNNILSREKELQFFNETVKIGTHNLQNNPNLIGEVDHRIEYPAGSSVPREVVASRFEGYVRSMSQGLSYFDRWRTPESIEQRKAKMREQLRDQQFRTIEQQMQQIGF